MRIHYPESLPISLEKEQIIQTIQQHQVVILAGDTGSGKTTQLPKMCLEAFPENKLLIGCTQPRRIAATSVSTRVAEELQAAPGWVAYKIRFHDKTCRETQIKFMTDGVLLAETKNDPLLRQYGVIIVDEAHERSLNIDFLLGYLKRLLPKRPDLKLIVTSATIDTQAFSKHFNNAPIISVSGRTYPVDVQYQPQEDLEAGDKDNIVEHCVQVTKSLIRSQPEGDILIFLATEKDIRECSTLLENSLPDVNVLKLYGRLASGDQRKIFHPSRRLKVIVSTNVAETSLTVPGIRYVVDSGLARISSYNVRAKTTSLPITRISQASCNQRKGRCGRVGPGLCIRLYSEEDYNSRDEYTVPEIKRSNLAEVILQMISLKLGDPSNFPFIDPPYKNAIREGYRLLSELGAINNRKQLTANGKIMAELPIDPCIARIIIEAKKNNCLREIQVISAALAIADPRVRPAEKEQDADIAHKAFNHPHSDFSTLVNIWESFHEGAGKKKSWSYLKKYCKTHFLSFQRMREWFDLHDQLNRIITRRKEFEVNETPASYESIHTALLAGFLRNLAKKKEKKIYDGTHNKEFMIFPGSGQFSKSSDWIMCGSFIDTNRLYAINVASISQDWIEPTARHLCKYSWSNPRWRRKSGTVVAEESVSLFGLHISAGKVVNYGKRDARNIKEARDIFIQQALVQAELNGHYRFLQKNLALINKWQKSEEKLRIRNIVSDDVTFFQFYDQVIPGDVYDQPTLNRFLKKGESTSALFMVDDDVILRKPDENELLNFPQKMQLGLHTVRLDYSFDPGSENDGVTYRLPVGMATVIKKEHFDWLVPGLFTEKLTFLLKSLPKSLRKRLVPVSDTVCRILDDVNFGKGPLLPALESSIQKLFGFQINRSDWSDELPVHLTPRFTLVDENNKEFVSGRDLEQLISLASTNEKAAPQSTVDKKADSIIKKWQSKEFTTWDFTSLPTEVTLVNSSGEVSQILFPALMEIPDKAAVKICFIPDYRKACAQNSKGFLTLFRLQFPEPYKAIRKLCATTLSGPSVLQLLSIAGNKKEMTRLFLSYVLQILFGEPAYTILSKDEFDSRVTALKQLGFYKTAQGIVQSTMSLLRLRREIVDCIESTFQKSRVKGHTLPPVKENFYNQLDLFFPLSFLREPSYFKAEHVERYLKGLKIRLERFYVDPRKDQQKEQQLTPYINQLNEVNNPSRDITPEAAEAIIVFKQMINDYSLTLFAPEIKGGASVSAKKLKTHWSRVRSLS